MFRGTAPVLHLELTIPSLLGDSAEQTIKRRNETQYAMDRLFRYAVTVFGETDARRHWAGVAKKPRGAPKGSRDPAKDQRLLTLYDEAISCCTSKTARAKVPGEIGKLIAAAKPARYGNSSDAITKHVRRLIQERDKQRREEEERMRRLFGRSQPGFRSILDFSARDATTPQPNDTLGGLSSEGQEFAP